jgi:hypothetical protein
VKTERALDEIEQAFQGPGPAKAVAALSPAQRGILHEYWVDRARGELTTALTFEFMRDDLIAERLPAEVVALAAHAVEDEHRHVDWCLRWARAIEPTVAVEPELSGTRPMALDGASAHDNRLLRTVFGCCFSETVAVHVLRASQRLIREPSVQKLNQQHLREEVGHSRLGWALVGWPGLTARDREMLAAFIPEMTRLVREVWLSTERPGDDALHALGYLSSAVIAPAAEEALDQVILPGLAQLGIS